MRYPDAYRFPWDGMRRLLLRCEVYTDSENPRLLYHAHISLDELAQSAKDVVSFRLSRADGYSLVPAARGGEEPVLRVCRERIPLVTPFREPSLPRQVRLSVSARDLRPGVRRSDVHPKVVMRAKRQVGGKYLFAGETETVHRTRDPVFSTQLTVPYPTRSDTLLELSVYDEGVLQGGGGGERHSAQRELLGCTFVSLRRLLARSAPHQSDWRSMTSDGVGEGEPVAFSLLGKHGERQSCVLQLQPTVTVLGASDSQSRYVLCAKFCCSEKPYMFCASSSVCFF